METALQQGNTNTAINTFATLWCFAAFELAVCVLLHSLAECEHIVISQDMFQAAHYSRYTQEERYLLGIASCAGKAGLTVSTQNFFNVQNFFSSFCIDLLQSKKHENIMFRLPHQYKIWRHVLYTGRQGLVVVRSDTKYFEVAHYFQLYHTFKCRKTCIMAIWQWFLCVKGLKNIVWARYTRLIIALEWPPPTWQSLCRMYFRHRWPIFHLLCSSYCSPSLQKHSVYPAFHHHLPPTRTLLFFSLHFNGLHLLDSCFSDVFSS